MKVRLLSREAPNGTCCTSLTIGKEYEVLGIEADWYRLLNDRREPAIYNPVCFQVVEASEPENWVSKVEDGVRYAYPPGWGQPGFFEDWHDAVPEVRQQFSADLERWYPQTATRG